MPGEIQSSYNSSIISGTCVCPGQAIGRFHVYNKETEDIFEKGDILYIPSEIGHYPIKLLRMAGGIICSYYTTYSHLASVASALRIPCIVGAVFSAIPENLSVVFLNTYYLILTEDLGVKGTIDRTEENEWNKNINNIIVANFNNSPLVYLQSFDYIGSYIDKISGIFLDSLIFENDLFSVTELIEKLNVICKHHSDIIVYYRFTTNILGIKDERVSLQQEYNFVHSLLINEIKTNTFIASAKSYEDIVQFRHKILSEFNGTSTMKIGSMIENLEILEDLIEILRKRLIDFGVIGINDLTNSCLGLDRDDPHNQEYYLLESSNVLKALSYIHNTFVDYHTIDYISFPKYPRFLSDYKTMCGIGFSHYFGNDSLFYNMNEL